MAQQLTDRRRFLRIDFQSPVTLAQGTQEWSCKLIDISIKGALLEPPASCQPDPDLPLTVTLVLDEINAIVMVGALAHQVAGQLGVNCQQIDVDSIAHLRKLIDLNSGDPSAAERELKLLGA